MQFPKFFIDRPIFATVLSIITIIIGVMAFFTLPIEQYPSVAPPTIQVSANYPGATAETVADTVATPIEQEVNGVEGMLYMYSQASSDGSMTLTITFELGTDLDTAQVLVQNRVAIAEPRLPEVVRSMGVTTKKNTPDLMLVVNMSSPDGTYDQSYLANYGVLNVRDRLRRIDGVGDVRVFGASDYAMRIWLKPDLMQSYGIAAGDIISALRTQNVQVASGTLNRAPQTDQNYYEYIVQTQGRLESPEEFGNVIVKADNGRIVRLQDVARIELGAQEYVTKGYLGDKPAVALPIYQRPGTNAIETTQALIAEMKDIAKDFPPGIEYEFAYNPTEFIEQSVEAVEHTVYEAIFLVVIVILVFLQTWRAAIIPIVAIPVSLIGTFAVMSALGFSLNNLTLFGLVLAIGIVVDDAIVIVENMERNLRNGLSPREAARKTMDEVGTALIAMGLVLVAVFLPTTFLEGISGKFYQAFGLTVAVATMISVSVSLTLSPALAAILMKTHDQAEDTRPLKWYKSPLKLFFRGFNNGLSALSNRYGWFVGKTIRMGFIMLLIYGGLMTLTVFQFDRVPTGFIPSQDQGSLIVSITLPEGASIGESDEVIQEVSRQMLEVPGLANTVGFTGFSGATRTLQSNAAVIFTPLEPFSKRIAEGIEYQTILSDMRKIAASFKDAQIAVFERPPVPGIGSAGGFKMMLQDRGGRGLKVLEQAASDMAAAANSPDSPATTSVFSFFNTNNPQLYLDIDRNKAERLGIPVDSVFEALEVFIGSVYINDFNYLGRTFRVTAQADADKRLTIDDALRIRVRSVNGDMVPIGSFATVNNTSGPSRVPRYNLYPAAGLMGSASPGFSSDEALTAMEDLADQILPDGIGYEWTEIAYQQKATGDTAVLAFALAVVFVFLLLAAQYESWTLPLSIILIVPMCLLSAITGVYIAGMDNNILTQIGLVVLVGLASKNAILIVEFARELEDQGRDMWQAAVEAARLRLRPILMTSFAFILGVVPMVVAEGAGAEMRQALGVAVFSGMLGVTAFGLIFTPVFYVLCRKLSLIRAKKEPQPLSSETV